MFMSDNVETEGFKVENHEETSTIKKIREQYKSAIEALKSKESELEELSNRLREYENEKLSAEEKARRELEALKSQVDELAPLKERLEKAESAAKDLYEQALSKIPEDKREIVKSLTLKDSYVESFKAVELVRDSFLKDIKFGKPEPAEPVRVEIQQNVPQKSIAEEFRSIDLKEAISSRLSNAEVENARRLKRLIQEVD